MVVRGDVNGNRSWACRDRRAWRWRFGGVRRKWGAVEGGGGGWEKGEEGGGGGRGRRGHRLERQGWGMIRHREREVVGGGGGRKEDGGGRFA